MLLKKTTILNKTKGWDLKKFVSNMNLLLQGFILVFGRGCCHQNSFAHLKDEFDMSCKDDCFLESEWDVYYVQLSCVCIQNKFDSAYNVCHSADFFQMATELQRAIGLQVWLMFD